MKRLRFIPRKDFQKDLKELAHIDKTIIDDVMTDIDLLCENYQLPAEFSDHALTGRLEGVIVIFMFELLKKENYLLKVMMLL
ncbi:hypothetical protein LACWKB8_1333 [Lactobacillus sp. wkB8]|uniref:type II toxin-antitoxin system mRNA interferase toxin, RelE/StbE family n=1 Tax=Lactobacillus sp. wkB8 TaxID=1545702 RepID=UPI00050D83E6|nr:hypothetical protein LACWKB8_1333 [Lactobacillus sp. wkB8]